MNILALLDGNFFYVGDNDIICCRFRREVNPNGLAAIKLNNDVSANFRERLLNALNRITRFDPVLSLRDSTVRITRNPNTGNRDIESIYYRLEKIIDVYNVDLGNEERNTSFRDELTNVIICTLTTGWWPESYNVVPRPNAERSVHGNVGFYEYIPNIEQEQKFKDYMHGDALIDRINNCAELCGSAKEIPIVIRSKDFTAKITDTSIEENVLYIDIEIDGAKEKEEKEELRPREPRHRRTLREGLADTLRVEAPENYEETPESEGEENAVTFGDGIQAQVQRDERPLMGIDRNLYETLENSWQTIDIGSIAANGTITGTAIR